MSVARPRPDAANGRGADDSADPRAVPSAPPIPPPAAAPGVNNRVLAASNTKQARIREA